METGAGFFPSNGTGRGVGFGVGRDCSRGGLRSWSGLVVGGLRSCSALVVEWAWESIWSYYFISEVICVRDNGGAGCSGGVGGCPLGFGRFSGLI